MRRMLLPTALILMLGGGILAASHGTSVPAMSSAKESGDSSLNQEYARWEKRIQETGGEGAYREFIEEYAPLSFARQHPAAHIIGEALYRVLGLEGIGVCDESFAFGCFHGFLAHAIAGEGGLEAVSRLDTLCLEIYGTSQTGCHHGIGHGVLEYVGRDNVEEALGACEKTYQPDPMFGCAAGVFMEHFTSGNFVEDGQYQLYVKEFDEKNPYEPCNTEVSEKYRPSCYHQMALWWHQVLSGDTERVGFLCAALEGREWEACMRGVGNIVASTNEYRADLILRSCGLMPDARAEMACRAGAAWRLVGYEAVDELRRLCAFIDEPVSPVPGPCENGLL